MTKCRECGGEYYPLDNGGTIPQAGQAELVKAIGKASSRRRDEPGLYTFTIYPCEHARTTGMTDDTPFMTSAALAAYVGPDGAAKVLAALAELVAAAQAEIDASEPCPICGNMSFVHEGTRYTRRPGRAFIERAVPVFLLQTGQPTDPCFFESDYYKNSKKFSAEAGHPEDPSDFPFVSESYLYMLLGKEDGRSVLAYTRGIVRAVGGDPWIVELEATRAWNKSHAA